MEYYRLIQESSYKNVITPVFPTISKIWGEKTPIFVPGEVREPDKRISFLPFYQATVRSGAFLVSKPMGDLWKEYQRGGRYRPCAMGHIKTREIHAYYFMYPRLLEALHRDTQYLPDGEIRTLCLAKERIQVHKVFGIKGNRTVFLILAGDVLDRMMREGITGYQAEPLNVREGWG